MRFLSRRAIRADAKNGDGVQSEFIQNSSFRVYLQRGLLNSRSVQGAGMTTPKSNVDASLQLSQYPVAADRGIWRTAETLMNSEAVAIKPADSRQFSGTEGPADFVRENRFLPILPKLIARNVRTTFLSIVTPEDWGTVSFPRSGFPSLWE